MGCAGTDRRSTSGHTRESQRWRPRDRAEEHQRLGGPAPVPAGRMLALTPSVPGIIALQAAAGNHAVASVLQRKRDKPKKPETRVIRGPHELAEDVWQSLLAFSARATSEQSRVEKSLKGYLDRYDAAYRSFSGRLSKGQQEAAAREKWSDAMAGIVIGVGVGLAAGGLYTATTMIGKMLYEAMGEGSELLLAKAAGGSSAVDFAPPPDLNADKVARGHLETLLAARQAVDIISAAIPAFSPHRDKLWGINPSAKGGAPRSSPSIKSGTPKSGPALEQELGRLKAGLDAADQALAIFLATMDTPLLDREQLTLEQDIWIKWMSRQRGNAGLAIAGDGAVADRLKELRILGRIAPGHPIGGEEAFKLLWEELERMEWIGQLLVVIVPPRPPTGKGRLRIGMARLRHDAYAAAGRADPRPSATPEYVQIGWEPQTYLRPGEVVMVRSTTSSGLVVDRVGASLPVVQDERDSALRLLGVKEDEYRPEIVETLGPLVQDAVAGGMRYEPPLKLVFSEDGVLVSEKDGTKLVLFTFTDFDFVGAGIRRERVGAPRVVAADLEGKVEEFRVAGIVVTGRLDHEFILNEIRAARRGEAQSTTAVKR